MVYYYYYFSVDVYSISFLGNSGDWRIAEGFDLTVRAGFSFVYISCFALVIWL